jgi:hypothetical protein
MDYEGHDRIVYYSNYDGTTASSLIRAEEILSNLEFSSESNINDQLEIYNIKIFFDNGAFLLKWSIDDRSRFVSIVEKAWIDSRVFWRSLNSKNIINHLEILNYLYVKNFWFLIGYFQVYNSIDKETFRFIIFDDKIHIANILNVKTIVDYYDKEIRLFLMEYSEAAELILLQTEVEPTNRPYDYNFPKNLSTADKEHIIAKYIDDPNVNLNYLRIINHSRDTILRLSPKIRLKARKKFDYMTSKLFQEGDTISTYSCQVSLDLNQDEPLKITGDNYSYSVKFLDCLINDNELFGVYRFLFRFINECGIINLVSKQNERIFYENIVIKSKHEYESSIGFKIKNQLAENQIIMFGHYLNYKGSSLEKNILGFIELSFKDNSELKNIQFKLPPENSSYLQKIRILVPELEFLLRQYDSFVNEKCIDFELISLNSEPLNYGQLKSLVQKKYLYIDNDVIKRLKYSFFSNQCFIYHIEPYGNKYSNFYDLINNEEVFLGQFEDYQKPDVERLINSGYLVVSEDGSIKIKDDIYMYIIRELNNDEVISYWYYPPIVRSKIDEMVKDGLLRFENTLFTQFEVDYFNYYLNKKKFTNGDDLRNKYMHGTNSNSEIHDESQYFILVKIIILILIKIEDDFRVSQLINVS